MNPPENPRDLIKNLYKQESHPFQCEITSMSHLALNSSIQGAESWSCPLRPRIKKTLVEWLLMRDVQPESKKRRASR